MEILDSDFYEIGYYTKPINWEESQPPGPAYFYLFDQEGYDLSNIEILFALENNFSLRKHRNNYTLSKEWILQTPPKTEGAVLNHGLLFERKGFKGEALEQIKKWSEVNPLFFSLIKMKPKWGIDLSIDFYSPKDQLTGDREVFECFHYEWDSFQIDETKAIKEKIESLVLTTDFNKKGMELMEKKEEWYPLDYFERSKYRTILFGLPLERFKMVPWM